MITTDSKNILVADGSLSFRELLSDILVEAGHKVKFASDAKAVTDEIKANCDGIDLLSLDIQMPQIDGFGVLEWINENGYKGKFPILVVIGAHGTSRVIKKIKDLGATGLMTKAFTPEQTITRIHQLLFPEKRKTIESKKRVSVSIPVDYRTNDVFETGYLLNVSETGVFLHTNFKFSIGTRMNLQFALPGAHKIMDVDGTVKWFTDQKAGKGFFRGCGTKLDSISEEDRKSLRDFVDAEFKQSGSEYLMTSNGNRQS